jgi:acyl carrier protein
MRTVLGLSESAAARVNEKTTAVDLEEWSSVTHLALILELEQAFGVQFPNEEIAQLGSVEGILASLAEKGVPDPV